MIPTNLATFICLLVCLGQLVDSNPFNHRQHSFSSRSGPNGNSYSGSSYQSLGIQASHQQPQQGMQTFITSFFKKDTFTKMN